MAKKNSAPSGRRLFSFPSLPRWVWGGLIFFGAAVGLWQSGFLEEWGDRLDEYITNQQALTWEQRVSPEGLMEQHKTELLGHPLGQKSFQEPRRLYAPYLLCEVKYTKERKSREGLLLLSLLDGEMVVGTDPWETTHGLKDCLEAGISSEEFLLLRLLAKRPDGVPLEDLQKEMKLEKEPFGVLVTGLRQKHLLVQKGPLAQLHVQEPRFAVIPESKIAQRIVLKPLTDGQKIPSVYSKASVRRMAQAVFGEEFKVKNTREIFLPVIRLQVTNPDGSTYATDWNGVTGARMVPVL